MLKAIKLSEHSPKGRAHAVKVSVCYSRKKNASTVICRPIREYMQAKKPRSVDEKIYG